MEVVLASASPRRRELLGLLVRNFICMTPDLDEAVLPAEAPADYVARLAEAKARAVNAGSALVIAADTAVTIDGLILGKPADPADARAMLRKLSGRSHEVVTGLSVQSGECMENRVIRTQVEFTLLSDGDIEHYLGTDEPWDKAGAYAIQGRAGTFVKRIDGSYSSVVGLPLAETKRLLARFGVMPEW